MKKTVILTLSMFLVTSAFAGEKIVVASAASTQQAQSKRVVAKKVAAKASEKPATTDYALESFGCCGLPQ